MPARIEAAAGVLRRLIIWGAYAAFVAIVTASWITARPASAEVPRGAALGAPAPSEADDEDRATSQAPARRAVATEGPVFGPPAPEARASDPAPAGGRTKLVGRLNINSATREELVLLPGIGDAISSRVIAWRARHGRFHRVKDLRRVRGIGPKTLETLRPHLTVIGPTTLRPAN